MADNRVVRARRMFGFWLGTVVLMAGLVGFSAHGATGSEGSAEETNALQSAYKLFADMQYPLAETNFSNFLATFTNSTHRAYAILFLARSQLEQSNGASAMAL
ncbi:MAG TPA: hypothetical protein VMQ67_07515, partial [Candidatus Saccharimonadales bacterium]|nr:hypothetical protein [Candidatus Saccharimonadales bacterium]